jgi:hypothetical protein
MNHLLAVGPVTIVLNIENNSVKMYDFICTVGRNLGVSYPTILSYINSGKLLKGIYLMSIKKIIHIKKKEGA